MNNAAPTFEGVTAWVEQIIDGQERVLSTNVLLALESGEMATEENMDAILEQAQPILTEARESVHQQIVALVTRLKANRNADITAKRGIPTGAVLLGEQCGCHTYISWRSC